jgi:hypothetical protein
MGSRMHNLLTFNEWIVTHLVLRSKPASWRCVEQIKSNEKLSISFSIFRKLDKIILPY